MKIKTLVWTEYANDTYFTQDDIPHLYYLIHQVDVGPIYGLFFANGYVHIYGELLAKSNSVDELKAIAQTHWNNYVKSSYLE